MIDIETRLKAWGNSIGIIIPKDILKKNDLDIDDDVEVIVKKKTNVLRETFGTYKFKKPTKELLKEIDEDLDPE